MRPASRRRRSSRRNQVEDHRTGAANQLRALALAAPQRSPQLPTVPTLAEAGFPDLDFRIWLGLMAPAGTPDPIVRTIESALVESLRDPALRSSLVAQGWDVSGIGGHAGLLDREVQS